MLKITVESIKFLLSEIFNDKIKVLGTNIDFSDSDILKIAKDLIENKPTTAPVAWRAKDGDAWEINDETFACVVNLYTHSLFTEPLEDEIVFVNLENGSIFFKKKDYRNINCIPFNYLCNKWKSLKHIRLISNSDLSEEQKKSLADAIIEYGDILKLKTNFAIHYYQSENRL